MPPRFRSDLPMRGESNFSDPCDRVEQLSKLCSLCLAWLVRGVKTAQVDIGGSGDGPECDVHLGRELGELLVGGCAKRSGILTDL